MAEPEGTMGKRRDAARILPWMGLGLVLALFIGLRLYHGGMPLVDDSDWRQTDTASEAWFFLHQGLGLLPQLFYNGPGPSYVQLEMPFLPWTVALLGHLFPFGDWLLHSVAVGYSTAGLICLWLFARRRFGDGVALATAAIFTVSPLGIFFGRAFQPEPAMVAGITASLWLTQRWADRGGTGNYLLAMAAIAFALLAKLPAAVVTPAIFLIALQRSRWNRIEPWALLAVPTLLAGLYTVYGGIAVTPGYNFVTTIFQLLRHSSYHVGLSSAPEFWYHFLLEASISGAGAIPLAVGLLSPRLRQGWFWAWAGALVLWCLLVVSHIRFEYYLVPLLPWLAIAEGVGLWEIVGRLGNRRLIQGAIVAAVIVGTPLFSLHTLQELYTLNWTDYQIGIALRADLGPGTLILGTENPPILFYSRHHGWRTSQLTMSELQRWIAKGAHYYIPLGSLSIPAVQTYVQTHFAREMAGGAVYYNLRMPATSPGSKDG